MASKAASTTASTKASGVSEKDVSYRDGMSAMFTKITEDGHWWHFVVHTNDTKTRSNWSFAHLEAGPPEQMTDAMRQKLIDEQNRVERKCDTLLRRRASLIPGPNYHDALQTCLGLLMLEQYPDGCPANHNLRRWITTLGYETLLGWMQPWIGDSLDMKMQQAQWIEIFGASALVAMEEHLKTLPEEQRSAEVPEPEPEPRVLSEFEQEMDRLIATFSEGTWAEFDNEDRTTRYCGPTLAKPQERKNKRFVDHYGKYPTWDDCEAIRKSVLHPFAHHRFEGYKRAQEEARLAIDRLKVQDIERWLQIYDCPETDEEARGTWRDALFSSFKPHLYSTVAYFCDLKELPYPPPEDGETETRKK